MAAKGQAPTKDCMSFAPVGRVIEAWIEENRDEDGVRLCELVWPHSPITSALRRLSEIRKNSKYIRFDLADRILVATDNVALWHVDPELHEAWNSGVVAEADARDARLVAA